MTKGSAFVDDWVRQSIARQDAVLRDATQRLFDFANLSRFKGGNMPIDVGFLRGSFVTDIGSMPAGPSMPGGEPVDYDQDVVRVTLSNVRCGDVIFGGWAAKYAAVQEHKYYHFRELAGERWTEFVAASIVEAKSRVG
jgi:hypothetical protein